VRRAANRSIAIASQSGMIFSSPQGCQDTSVERGIGIGFSLVVIDVVRHGLSPKQRAQWAATRRRR
jgi:hypothetical protein